MLSPDTPARSLARFDVGSPSESLVLEGFAPTKLIIEPVVSRLSKRFSLLTDLTQQVTANLLLQNSPYVLDCLLFVIVMSV